MRVVPFGWTNLQQMQVAPFGGQICNFLKWLHLVAKFATNASGVMLLLNLIQFTESISGSVVPLAMFELRPNGAKIAEVMRQDCGGYARTTLPLLGRTTGVRQQLCR